MAPQVSAILLAAGSSRRMGTCKQLLPLGDRPAIVHCLENLAAAGIVEPVVVVNPANQELVELLHPLAVTLAANDAPESDMAGSVRAGLRRLETTASGILVVLADHPLVTAATYRALAAAHAEEPDAIVIPVRDGRKGHPTLFPRPLLALIDTLPTLREIIGRHWDTIRLLPLADEGITLDMDVWADYQRLAGMAPQKR